MSSDLAIFGRKINWRWVVTIVILMVGLSFAFAWVSSGFDNIFDWPKFLVTFLVSGGVYFLGWMGLVKDKSISVPTWLVWLVIVAIILRLSAAILWYAGLPNWGYATEVEQAGYIMADAFARDTAAWELAQSAKPLVMAFSDYRVVDQYGGMVYLSGSVYRYIGGEHHHSIQFAVLTAVFSSIAIIFTWAFSRRLWGERVALVAAWLVALFPDAIILGSSQMREAFLMTLIAVGLYGLVRYVQDRTWSGLAWLAASLFLILPFSPPIAGVFLLVVLILAISIEGVQIFHQPRFWAILVAVAFVVGIGIWLAWERIAPEGITNPVALVNWWFRESARWQAYFVKRSSPLIRRIFNTTPDWIHTPILLGYGVLQPFLPGALLDQGAPMWKSIAIVRSVGWTLILPFLLVAPVVLWAEKENRRLAFGVISTVWLTIVIAALRSGGDLWDNPRYRVVFISLQAGLVAWVWISQRQSRNPWLWRMIIGLMIILAWFVPWYLRRSGLITWPITNVFITLGFGFVSAAIFFIWMYFRGRQPRNFSPQEEDPGVDKKNPD
ncbi:MAG: glycosyltransferase family 39 protein [Chloroflexota bacterium]|nr:MAG: glycosyltransferase family 39 protein [Chloroflexota bacterium]